MNQTNPDFVVVELCKQRAQTLSMSEEMIKEQMKDVKFFELLKRVR